MSAIYNAREELTKGHDSFTAMLVHRLEETPEREAFRYPGADGEWVSLTWAQVGEEATLLAAGLIALGSESEQRVAIAGDTSMKWILADLGIALAGGAVTTVYSSTGAEDVAYILSDSIATFSSPRTKVSSRRFWNSVTTSRNCTKLCCSKVRVTVISPSPSTRCVSLAGKRWLPTRTWLRKGRRQYVQTTLQRSSTPRARRQAQGCRDHPGKLGILRQGFELIGCHEC